MSNSPRRCLVLGGKSALQQIEGAIEQALGALGLERVQLPSVEEMPEFLSSVDVVLADVSRVSPSISYELGVASAIGVPVVYVAESKAQAPAVFAPVLTYTTEVGTARLGYVIAKALDDAIAGRPRTDAVSELNEVAPNNAVYERGQKFLAVVAHVRVDQGYVLVAELGRKPVLLPVSQMIDSDYIDAGQRLIREGDLVFVEVDHADPLQDRVTVKESKAPAQIRVPKDLTRVAYILRAWALIEPVADRNSAAATVGDLGQRLREWVAIYPSATKRLRNARNRITHGELPDSDDLDALEGVSAEVLGLVLPARRMASDQSVADLVSRLRELEEQLLLLLRVGGGSGWVESRGLRGLATAAERADLIHPETRETVYGLSKVRNELVHGDLRGFDDGRIEGLRNLTTSVLEVVWQAVDRARTERETVGSAE